MSVNRVILLGNLGKDLETRQTDGGLTVAKSSLATRGRKKDETNWHNLVFFGKTAEKAAEYFSKGSAIYVEGAVVTREYTLKESGEKRYITEILVDNFRFVPSNPKRAADDDSLHRDEMSMVSGTSPASDIPF